MEDPGGPVPADSIQQGTGMGQDEDGAHLVHALPADPAQGLGGQGLRGKFAQARAPLQQIRLKGRETAGQGGLALSPAGQRDRQPVFIRTDSRYGQIQRTDPQEQDQQGSKAGGIVLDETLVAVDVPDADMSGKGQIRFVIAGEGKKFHGSEEWWLSTRRGEQTTTQGGC